MRDVDRVGFEIFSEDLLRRRKSFYTTLCCVVFTAIALRNILPLYRKGMRHLVENAGRRLFSSHLHGAEDAVYAAVGEV